MIYASLKPIPRWHHPLVPVNYLLLGLMTGALLLQALLGLFGKLPAPVSWFTAVVLVVALAAKLAYWRSIDRAPASEHGRKRHRPGRAGPGAPAGGAPYRGQLPDEGDGPQHRAQACRQAAPPRHRLRIPAAAAADPALPRPAAAGGRIGRAFLRRRQACAACCWSAGSSSPRRSTASRSITAPRRFRRSGSARVLLSSGGQQRIQPRIDRRARCN